MRYRYRLATSAFLYGGTGTGQSGTGIGWPLLNSSLGVPVQVRAVLVHLPLYLFPSIVALPETSPSDCHHPQ